MQFEGGKTVAEIQVDGSLFCWPCFPSFKAKGEKGRQSRLGGDEKYPVSRERRYESTRGTKTSKTERQIEWRKSRQGTERMLGNRFDGG